MIVLIRSDMSIVQARVQGREFASELGFSGTDLTVITTAISELARNIVTYAKRGEIRLRSIKEGVKEGIVIVAHDYGPGFRNPTRAGRGVLSTTGRRGLGLLGAERSADEFEIVSRIGCGTTVTVTKWKR